MSNHLQKNKSHIILVSLFAAAVLVFSKAMVGVFSNSISILASALDSFFDLFVSTTNYFAIQKSDAPPTRNFRYGFGKIEGLGGLFQGIIIGISGIILGYFGIRRILFEEAVSHLNAGIGIMIFSIIITFFLVRYLKKAAKKHKSLLIEADAAHYESDLLSNLAVLMGIFIVFFTEKAWIDGVISTLIAIVIVHSGFNVAKKSVFCLLDHEAPEEIRTPIEKVLQQFLAVQKITGYHFLRTRQAGSKILVDVHLVFTPKISLLRAHQIGDEVELAFRKIITNGEVLIHLDPVDDSTMNNEQ